MYAIHQRIRRTTWRAVALVFFVALRNCHSAQFEVKQECQQKYESAWGHPAVRRAAIKHLNKLPENHCPSNERISTAGRALLVGANLVSSAADNCWDVELENAAKRVCGSDWQSRFKSELWHAHQDGVQQFPPAVVVLLASTVLIVVIDFILACFAGKKLE